MQKNVKKTNRFLHIYLFEKLIGGTKLEKRFD